MGSAFASPMATRRPLRSSAYVDGGGLAPVSYAWRISLKCFARSLQVWCLSNGQISDWTDNRARTPSCTIKIVEDRCGFRDL